MTAGNPALPPFKWAGLWIRPSDREGVVSMCTGQFIAPRIMLTAAHCVRDRFTGAYYDSGYKQSRFLLQYQNSRWSEAYKVVCAATWPEWIVKLRLGEDATKPRGWSEATRDAVEASWQWDYAFVLLDHESVTGTLPVDFDARGKKAVAMGYPNAIMHSEIVQYAVGEVFDSSALVMTGSPNVNALWHGSLGFSQGSSGGAWLIERGGQFSVVGINSYGNESRPGASFGPQFTADFDMLQKFVAAGCPESERR